MNRSKTKPSFNKTKFNWIPEDWNIEQLRNLTKDGISNGTFNDPEKRGRGYRLINVVNLYSEPSIDTSNLSRLDIPDKEFKRNKVNFQDLLFTRSSLKLEGIAHCNINLDESNNLTYDDHIMKITPNREVVNPVYLRLFCLADIARNHFMRLAKQTTMTTISQKDVMKLPVLVPTLKEQNEIVQTFSKWDKAISTLKKLIQAKKFYKKGLMQQLLSGKKRFPEFVTSEDTFETKFGNYPKDWSYVKIREIAEKLVNKNGSETSNHTVLSCTKHNGLVDSMAISEIIVPPISDHVVPVVSEVIVPFLGR